MMGARRGNLRRAAAAGSALALLVTLAACSNDDDPVAEPAPGASATAEPEVSADPSATAAPDAGPEAGNGVGAVHVRSTHLTSWAWGDPETKDPVVALIKAGKLDNV